MKNLQTLRQTDILVGTILLIVVSLLPTIAYGAEKMKILYDLSDAASMKPQVFKINLSNVSLFPVTHAGSVGTNSIGNAITIISFPIGTIKYDEFFHNAVEDLNWGGVYLPVISQDVIGFGQTRTFLIYDFRKNLVREFIISRSIEQYIEGIAIADAARSHFLFDIKKYNAKSNYSGDYTYLLQLIDLSGDQSKQLKQIDTGTATIWTAGNDRVFLYNLKTKELEVLDMNLNPANHPLAKTINRNKSSLNFTQIQLHPKLPFAILYDGRYEEMLIKFGSGQDDAPHPLLDNATQFSFSPDGKWVVFTKELNLDEKRTYLMPVSEKYPHYLGSPILLLNYAFDQNNAAWTTNPISFVGSRDDKIYRWELTNEAHPESNKATFWDYIVERDLAKLTKEKRQGLGKESK